MSSSASAAVVSVSTQSFRANIGKWGAGTAQDSDWTDTVWPTNQKTIYSASKQRAPHVYLVDINVESAPLALSGQWARLAGIAGFRWQNFQFVAYGPSYQYSLTPPGQAGPIPAGDGLKENFYFKDWFYLGGKGYFNFWLFELTLAGRLRLAECHPGRRPSSYRPQTGNSWARHSVEPFRYADKGYHQLRECWFRI